MITSFNRHLLDSDSIYQGPACSWGTHSPVGEIAMLTGRWPHTRGSAPRWVLPRHRGGS